MMMTREDVKSLYFDCYRHQQEDLPDYNAVKAKEYAALYPGPVSYTHLDVYKRQGAAAGRQCPAQSARFPGARRRSCPAMGIAGGKDGTFCDPSLYDRK